MAGKSNQADRGDMAMEDDVVIATVLERPRPLAPRLNQTEEQAHEALVAKLGEKSIWAKYANLD
jgi:DNA polymerase-3 subunit epsilon